jgi:hypothetical protein
MKFNYEEFKQYEQIEDKNYPFVATYKLDDGSVFYVEPVFHLKMEGVKQFRGERYLDLLKEMERLVRKNKIVVFCGEDDEESYGEIISVEGAIYLTIEDVCNPIHIYMENKSRGSDYGD